MIPRKITSNRYKLVNTSMSVSLTVDDEITIEKNLLMFYTNMGVSEDEAKERVQKFLDYINRIKGCNIVRESLVDTIVEEAWWAGIWLGKVRNDLVEYDPDAEETDDGLDPEEIHPNKGSEDDLMFG